MTNSSDRPITLVPWALGFVLGGGFVAAITWPLWGMVPELLKGPNAPAWVQAVGSVLAICVAILVPYYLHANEKLHQALKDELRARSFALALLPHAQKLAMQLRSARLVANDFDAPDGPDLEEASRIAAVPDSLQDRVTQLHELGEPARQLQAAIANIWEARKRLDYAAFFHGHGGQYWGEDGIEDLDEPDDYNESLKAAQRHLDEAVSAMQDMLR